VDPDCADDAGVHDDHGALVGEGEDGDDLSVFDGIVVAKGLSVLGVCVGGGDVEGGWQAGLQGDDGGLRGIRNHQSEEAEDEEDLCAHGAGLC
jgi:hypothetical protein